MILFTFLWWFPGTICAWRHIAAVVSNLAGMTVSCVINIYLIRNACLRMCSDGRARGMGIDAPHLHFAILVIFSALPKTITFLFFMLYPKQVCLSFFKWNKCVSERDETWSAKVAWACWEKLWIRRQMWGVMPICSKQSTIYYVQI